MPRFSIVVPIYNVEDYLAECLTSIVNQEFTDFECLLINDGSTDNSATIASDFAIRDSRFHYYKKDNGGLSDARNYGLSKTSGEYIVFVDSDDVISLQLLKIVEIAINKYSCDLVYFNHVKFFNFKKDIFYNSTIDEKDSHFSLMSNMQLAQKPNFAWARIAHRKLYDNITFPVGYIYEDVLTSPLLSAVANNICYIPSQLYGYRKRFNSITTGSAERQFKLFDTIDLLEKCVIEKRISYEFYSTAYVNLIQSCLVSLVRIKNAKARYIYLQMIKNRYDSLCMSDILSCYSLGKFKLLSLLAKNKITLLLLSSILSPLVSFSDKKGK